MTKNKFDYKFLLLKIAIYSSVIGLSLFQWFGPGLIQSYKAKKEWEQVVYGGSISEVNKYIGERNLRVDEISKMVGEEIEKNKEIFIYTNDASESLVGTLHANIKHEEHEEHEEHGYRVGVNVIEKNKDVTERLNFFIENKSSLGYNVFITYEGEEKELKLMNINDKGEEYKYQVVYFFYYTDKQKEHLTDQINKKPKNHFSFYTKPKNKQLQELDELQASRVILTEDELKSQKMESGIKSLLAPRINVGSGVFYFSCYNKRIEKALFEAKVENFKAMFLNGKNDSSGSLKEVKLMKSR